MAIIPRADESQVLNAGSPVPLATGDTAGEIQAKTLGSFSRGLSSVFIQKAAEIDHANTLAEREREKADKEEALTNYTTELAILEEDIKKDPMYGTMSSKDVLDKFKNSSRKIQDKYSSKLQGRVSSEFSAEAERYNRSTFLSFYANSIKEYNKNTDIKVGEFVSGKVSRISGLSDDPKAGSKIDDTFLLIENHINSNNIYTETEKQEKIAGAKKEIAQAYIDGYINKIGTTSNPSVMKEYADKAMRVLNGEEKGASVPSAFNITDMFDEKMREKNRAKVDSVFDRTANEFFRKEQMQQVMDAKAQKKLYEKTFKDMYFLGVTKVTDNEKLDLFREDIRMKAARGELDPTKIPALEKAALSSAAVSSYVNTRRMNITDFDADRKFKFDSYEKVFAGEDPMLVSADVYDGMTKRGASASAAIAVQTEMDRLSRALDKNPGIRAKVNEAAKRFDAIIDNPTIVKYDTRENQIKLHDAIISAKANLYERVVANPEVDISILSEDIHKSDIKPILDTIYPKEGFDKKSDKKTRIQALGNEIKELTKSGKMTKELNLEYARKIKEIQGQGE